MIAHARSTYAAHRAVVAPSAPAAAVVILFLYVPQVPLLLLQSLYPCMSLKRDCGSGVEQAYYSILPATYMVHSFFQSEALASHPPA
jgi:hypothetical protein